MNLKSIPRVQGIYKISNIESGLFYIGSSKNIRTRLREHFSRLARNAHNNCHLQSVYNLSGESVFQIELLEDCTGLTKDELLDKEQEYLDAISNWRMSYNQTRYTKTAGKIHSDEIEKRKLKVESSLGELNAFYGKTHSEDTLKEMAEAKRVRGSNVYKTKGGFWQVLIRMLETKSNMSLGTFKEESVARRVKYLAEEVYWYNNTSAEAELKELQKLARTLTDAAHEKGGGISLNSEGFYRVRITSGGKNIFLGVYESKDVANKVRNLAEKFYWGGDLSLEPELISLRKTSLQKHNFCGVGVVENKKGGYTATIRVNGRTKTLKTFATEAEARQHRIKAEKYFYENDQTFANLFYKEPKQPSSLPTGIIKRGEKYRASVVIGKQRFHFGSHATLEDAVKAREQGRQSLLS